MSPFHRCPQRFVGFALLALGMLVPAFHAPHARAQIRDGRAVPREGYFLSLEPYYAGDYRTAMRGFRSAARSGIRSPEGRWIDSICYYTMMGECFYQIGDLPSALEQHELALRIFVSHRDWMKRMRWPTAIQAAQLRPLPWGPSSRPSMPGQFPETVLSLQGTDVNLVLRQGGVVQQPELYPVRVMEIMRCVAVSIRRRNQILGPLAPHQSLSDELVRQLSTRQVVGNHWINTLVDVQLGLAKLSTGKDQEAMDLLKSSLVIAGQIDHPLTAMALLEMGKLFLAKEQHAEALTSFYEATFPAAQFAQADVLEEAFALATKAHLLGGGKTMMPPLQPAASWTQSNRMQRAAASILLSASENAALLNQTQSASALLSQSKRAMVRTDLLRTDLGARLSYDTALLAYQSGNISSGFSNLAIALKQRGKISPRLFQIARAVAMHRAKELSPRVATSIYAEVLREPTSQDWILDPFETLTYCTTPQYEAMQAWLELAMDRNEVALVVEIGDRIRRNKFFTQLPLGGRLLSLRWVLAGPRWFLHTDQQRRDLIDKYPALAETFQQIGQAQQSLGELPAAPESPDDLRRYEELSRQLVSLARNQETRLLEIALRPEAATRMFPPIRTLDEIQSQLKPGQAVLIFVTTPRKVQAVLLSAGNQYKSWLLPAPERVQKELSGMMQAIGNYNKNHVLDASLLTDEKWKQSAKLLFANLQEGLTEQVLDATEELTIVPDGFLWYLPFELLQTPAKNGLQPLIERTRIRYVPTASLAINDPRPVPTGGETAIVVGRLFGRESDQIIRAAAAQIRDASPRPAILRVPLPADSSILASRWDHLLVLDDIQNSAKDGFNWSPAQIDERQGRGSKLAAWMELPWAAPQQLILPGYHTLAEDGLRGRLSGDELLLTSCGLMAAGVRTVLFSRWRTGGQMSMEIVREFLQETPQVSAAAAWQRSVLLARSAELDPTQEPRLKGVEEDTLPTADHPFFWSGYLLIDSGSQPQAEQQE